ncbi:MAG: TldD/PmbA family protein [Pseudomonadota bacterium]
MTELKSLEADALKLVELTLKAGADACDVVVASGSSLSSSVRNGSVENKNRSEGDGISLRAFCGKKVASVNSNSKNNLNQLAERAVAMAKVSPEDPFQGLAPDEILFSNSDIEQKMGELDLNDTYEPNVEELEKLALQCEEAGLDVEGVVQSMGAGAASSKSGFVLAASNGFLGSYLRSGFSISASMLAGEGTGMQRDYDYDSATHFADLKSTSEIGASAGKRTVERLNPRQVNSGSYPIVFDPRISAGIVGTLAGAINGSSIARKTSFLRDKMHSSVARKAINIIDDPHMEKRAGSKVFDGEGVANNRLELVSDGILQTWLLDCATARELELKTNGRAGRGGSGTSPTTSNCYMEPGEQSPDEIISSIKDGLYLTETIGHGINMVTGDYSKGAAGFWIENGEIAFPVAEITVAGNLADMFLNMTPANNLEFKYATNAPTLLIEGMTIGGK